MCTRNTPRPASLFPPSPSSPWPSAHLPPCLSVRGVHDPPCLYVWPFSLSCACLRACVHACMYVCIWVLWSPLPICACVHACVCVRACVRALACACMCVLHAHACARVRACLCVRSCVRIVTDPLPHPPSSSSPPSHPTHSLNSSLLQTLSAAAGNLTVLQRCGGARAHLSLLHKCLGV